MRRAVVQTCMRVEHSLFRHEADLAGRTYQEPIPYIHVRVLVGLLVLYEYFRTLSDLLEERWKCLGLTADDGTKPQKGPNGKHQRFHHLMDSPMAYFRSPQCLSVIMYPQCCSGQPWLVSVQPVDSVAGD